MTALILGDPKPGSIRFRILDLLARSNPLFPAEICRRIEIDRRRCLDTLGALYREGRIAKQAPYRGTDALWTSLDRAYALPTVNVYTPFLPAPPRKPTPEPVQREPALINPRAIAHNRSVFDWRP